MEKHHVIFHTESIRFVSLAIDSNMTTQKKCLNSASRASRSHERRNGIHKLERRDGTQISLECARKCNSADKDTQKAIYDNDQITVGVSTIV